MSEQEFSQYGFPIPDESRVYTMSEALYFLRITYPTLKRRVKEGKLKGKKVAAHWYFRGDDLREYLGLKEETESNGN